MATIQEIQAAAKLKREKNLTTAQAVEQVRATPVTPTTPVIPTQNFPSQPLNQQTTTGVNGETFQVAPVNQQGITPQPQPTATTQPTPTQTTTTPIDKTAEIQAKNQAQMEANAQKSQLAIQERKQQEADAKLAATPTDQKSILTSLISGVSVPQQNTAAYRNAQFQYKNYQKFNSMTPQQLLDNMKMGEIDTATSQLLAGNPSYIKAKEDFDKFQKNQSINQMIKSVASGVTGRPETVDYAQQASDALARKLGIDETNADAYTRIVSQNPDVVERVKNVSSLTRQLNVLVQERNTIYKELKQQYPDLSASAIMTLMASRTQKWSTDIDSLNSSLAMEQADLKTAMELAKGEYEATKEDIALQAGIAKEDRAMKNSLALSQMEFDQKIAQQAQAMGTPELAIPEVINQYAQLGIMAQKSAQQHIADARAFISRGGTLGQYISQMQKDFQAKPEYKAKFAPKAEKSDFGFANLGGGMIAITDPKTGNVTFRSATGTNSNGSPIAVTASSSTGTNLLNTPEGTIIPSRLSQTTNPNNGKECGEYVNDIAGSSLFGNTIEQKIGVAKEQDGAIGKAIVWQPSNSPTFQKYGHVGVIIGQNPDGSWKVKSSNLKGDGAISIDDVPASVALGYKTLPGVNATSQQTTELGTLGQYLIDSQPRGPGFSEEDVKAYTSRINRLVGQGDETGVYKAFRDVLLSDKDLKEQIDTSKKFAGAIDNVQKLLNDYAASGKDTNALKSMAEQVARKLGLTTDEALARLQTQMGFTLADYIRSISGTAASDVEVQRLMGNMANLKNVKDLNDVILSQARQNAFTSVKTMIDTRMYGMPEDTKKGVFGDIYSMDSGAGTMPVASVPSVNNTLQADWDNLSNF